MNAISLSKHAEIRMRQRGLRPSDLRLILRCASEIGKGIYFLSRKDAEREIRQRKQEIQVFERLQGQKVVVEDDTVVTCYRSRRRDQKRLLRRGRERV